MILHFNESICSHRVGDVTQKLVATTANEYFVVLDDAYNTNKQIKIQFFFRQIKINKLYQITGVLHRQ